MPFFCSAAPVSLPEFILDGSEVVCSVQCSPKHSTVSAPSFDTPCRACRAPVGSSAIHLHRITLCRGCVEHAVSAAPPPPQLSVCPSAATGHTVSCAVPILSGGPCPLSRVSRLGLAGRRSERGSLSPLRGVSGAAGTPVAAAAGSGAADRSFGVLPAASATVMGPADLAVARWSRWTVVVHPDGVSGGTIGKPYALFLLLWVWLVFIDLIRKVTTVSG